MGDGVNARNRCGVSGSGLGEAAPGGARKDRDVSDKQVPGPFSIGSPVWPGASRVLEEGGELMQVLGKLIGAGGETDHWDGTDLRERLTEEIADLGAALVFFTTYNGISADAIEARTERKLEKYTRWHAEGLAARHAEVRAS
jgi:NTP pyrophosphatase (non-canonical NTP hydrolase)